MTTSSKPNIQILVLKYHSSINGTRAPWNNKDFEVWQVPKGKEVLKRVGGTQQDTEASLKELPIAKACT